MNQGAGRILQDLGIPASPTQQLGSCSIAVQQMVAIARAVDMECKVLILDEPTSSLDEQEVQKLFGLMRSLRKKGVGIIFRHPLPGAGLRGLRPDYRPPGRPAGGRIYH